MLISALYECVMWLGFLLFLPRLLYQCVRYGKYRTSFSKRFGFGLPKIERKGPIIWVHAVSVGECQAIASLAFRLKTEMPEMTLVVSSITETGQIEAKKVLSFADYHLFLPFDFFFIVRRVLSKCTPDMIILSEGDYWFQFLQSAKRRGSVIYVANGKMSERSERGFKALSFFSKKLFGLVDYFCVQNEVYKERFQALGVPASKLEVTGNLKGDAPLQPMTDEELAEFRSRLHITQDDIVLVIGSTHDPEEELLLGQIVPLLDRYPKLKVVLVPRHPERFVVVEGILQKHRLAYATWTRGIEQNVEPRCILVDAMGVLRKAYQVADIAIVAGSFTKKVGGHNILEAQVHGVPVLVGPYMHTQNTFLDYSKCFDAIVQVQNDGVGAALDALLQSPERQNVLSSNSLKMYQSLQGSTDKTMRSIYGLVPQFFLHPK